MSGCATVDAVALPDSAAGDFEHHYVRVMGRSSRSIG